MNHLEAMERAISIVQKRMVRYKYKIEYIFEHIHIKNKVETISPNENKYKKISLGHIKSLVINKNYNIKVSKIFIV